MYNSWYKLKNDNDHYLLIIRITILTPMGDFLLTNLSDSQWAIKVLPSEKGGILCSFSQRQSYRLQVSIYTLIICR